MVPLQLRIDESFFLPEERNGYLVSSEMKKVWAVELDLLNEFARVCELYHLKWFAHAGTMLGAVRHQGFIPWDDDIDIVMPRDDYSRLCTIGSSAFLYPYFFQNEETDRFFCRNFARLRNSETTAIEMSEKDYAYPYNQGIYIDIFAYDNLTDNDDLLESEMKKMESILQKRWLYRRLVHFYHPIKGKGLIKRIGHFTKHLWFKYVDRTGGDYTTYLKEHQRMVTAHNEERTKRVGEMIMPPLGRHIWKKEWLDNAVYLPFEMIRIPVPSNYEECLNVSFGKDWRTPKQIGALHGQVFFDVNRPYTDYIHSTHIS